MPIALSIIAVAFVLFGVGVFFVPTVTGWAHRPQTKLAIASPASALRSALGFGVLLSHASSVEFFWPEGIAK